MLGTRGYGYRIVSLLQGEKSSDVGSVGSQHQGTLTLKFFLLPSSADVQTSAVPMRFTADTHGASWNTEALFTSRAHP